MVRRKEKTNKRKYYALMIGVMMVALFTGGSMLQSTYVLDGGWSLEMSIDSMIVNTQPAWPGDAILVEGDADTGYDTVILSVDSLEPVNPNIYSGLVKRADTGAPAIGVSLGSFTQPIPVIDDSVQGEKTYTWSFSGYIIVQTFSAEMEVAEYNFQYVTDTQPSTTVAELGELTINVDVDFNLIEGENAVGTCAISEISTVGTQNMVDFYGVATDYRHPDTSSLKVPAISTLDAAPIWNSAVSADVHIEGDIAAGAEIFEGDMESFNNVVQYEVSFEVVQVVGELDTARFSVPPALNFLPTSADAIIADPTSLVVLMIVVFGVLVVFAGAAYLYGSPKKKP